MDGPSFPPLKDGHVWLGTGDGRALLPTRQICEFPHWLLPLLGLRKRLGRSRRYFAHVASSISLTFCYLLKQPGLFSFKRSVK